jgi:hypothetical protein
LTRSKPPDKWTTQNAIAVPRIAWVANTVKGEQRLPFKQGPAAMFRIT